jgi:G6PDH family F420-dependent oxidoreductase
MMPGRFFLGVGTGENLNEHVVGAGWPAPDVRVAMLEEAIELIRDLWRGEETSFRGDFYTAENARVYTLPETPTEIVVAAGKPEAARLAGRLGDGLCSTAPVPELVEAFEHAGGAGKPRYGMVHVCYAEDEAAARQTAREWWPNAAFRGDLGQELPRPVHFEQAARMPATTTSTSTRWGRSRRSSSPSTSARSCRRFEPRPREPRSTRAGDVCDATAPGTAETMATVSQSR